MALAALVLAGCAAGSARGARSAVVAFPPPGSCRLHGAGLATLPDPRCTPGALDPAVTQATIGATICRRGWTRTVRPPESVTRTEKRAAIAAYGAPVGSSPRAYEFDHLVPLELGGAPNAAANLWPQPSTRSGGFVRNPKDALESRLRRLVCAGRVTLADARRAIATDWVAAARRFTVRRRRE